MATLRPYATSKQAADIGGITPTDIGVSANTFVRKKELVSTGKFDESDLSSYGDDRFVNLDSVEAAVTPVDISVEWAGFTDVNASATSATSYLKVTGSSVTPVISITGGLSNVSSKVESYTESGWTHRVTLTFSENTTYSDRTSTVTATVTDGGQTVNRSAAIRQLAKEQPVETISVTPKKLSFLWDDTSSKTFTVTATGVYTVKAKDMEWATYTQGSGGTYTVTVLNNTGSVARTGTLTFTLTSNGATATVTVTQAATTVQEPSITFDKENYSVSASTSEVTASMSYENLTNLTAKVEGSLADATATVGSGSVGTVVVKFSANSTRTERVSTVTVEGTRVDGLGSYSSSFTVTQAAEEETLTVLPETLSFTAAPTEGQDLSITSNGDWTIE